MFVPFLFIYIYVYHAVSAWEFITGKILRNAVLDDQIYCHFIKQVIFIKLC